MARCAHEIARVCADTVEWPLLVDVTADFVYCRLHGSEELYAGEYKSKALDQWAARSTPDDAERAGPVARRVRRDVYVYFDNDTKLRAPADATSLMQRVAKAA